METNGKLKLLIQGGAVGIALALIFLIWFIVQSKDKIVTNHIEHSTNAFIENTKALTSLTSSVVNFNENQKETTEVLRELKDVIRYGK